MLMRHELADGPPNKVDFPFQYPRDGLTRQRLFIHCVLV